MTCAPYRLAPCAHHVAPSAEYLAFPSSEYSMEVGEEKEGRSSGIPVRNGSSRMRRRWS